ncbi:hypothetical protein [uncultured Rubinisphaera sp.]|uniref:hypothetical protein n=1 Tax=uncultured Rubinisphaera sp. TaxID=1678686 RepID=UPI0030DC3E54
MYARSMGVCRHLGYSKRGERWKLLDLLLAYAEEHITLFLKRTCKMKTSTIMITPLALKNLYDATLLAGDNELAQKI